MAADYYSKLTYEHLVLDSELSTCFRLFFAVFSIVTGLLQQYECIKVGIFS